VETSLTRYRDSFRKNALDLLWRQWSALGISGYGATDDDRVIDPETLVLFSTTVARHDPRLFDEILDWLQINGAWINLQRLSRLQETYRLAEPTVLAAMADYLSQHPEQRKWKSLTRNVEPLSDPRPFFPDLPIFGPEDETFLRWGWRRNRPQTRGMSQFPPPDRPTCFLFKLRALFGCQARADIMGWLLIHGAGHSAAIARELDYFRGSVQAVLNDLSRSGHVHSMRVGREKYFGIKRDEWRFLITWPAPNEFPRWENWIGRFVPLRKTSDLIERPDLEKLSAEVQAIELRKALDSAALARTVPPQLTDSPRTDLKGEDYLAANVSFLKSLTL